MSYSNEEDSSEDTQVEESSDDGSLGSHSTLRKRRRLSVTSNSSQSSQSSASPEQVEKLKRATTILRYILDRNNEVELEKFERGRTRLRFYYSPFSARRLSYCGSFALFNNNSGTNNSRFVNGKYNILMNKFRMSLLNNRWVDILKIARASMNFGYGVLYTGAGALSYGLMRPLSLSLSNLQTIEHFEKLQQIFSYLSEFRRVNPRGLQLDFAALLVTTNQNERIMAVLHHPLRINWRSFYARYPKGEAEIFALEAVCSVMFTPQNYNSSKTTRALKSSDHWVAAPLAWRANLAENSQDLDLIWYAIRGPGANEDGSRTILNCNVMGPSCCRLRYALSLANALLNRDRVNENGQPVSRGLDEIKAQFSDMLCFSPSDELLIFYYETGKLSQTDAVSLLFRILDSPKLARRKKLWGRLRYMIKISDGPVLEEIHRNWLGSRRSWWPAYIQEAALPRGSAKLARYVLSALQNL